MRLIRVSAFLAAVATACCLAPLTAAANDAVELQALNFTGNGAEPFLSCLQAERPALAGRLWSALDIVALQQKLTKRCFTDQGYVSSGLLLPAQDVRDGELEMQVRVGYLTTLSVESPAYPEKRVQNLFAPLLNKPLQLGAIRERLLLLEQDAAVAAVHADVQPLGNQSSGNQSLGNQPLGKANGSLLLNSQLLLQVVSAPQKSWSLQLDNYQPASIGEYGATLRAEHLSLTGVADPASVQLSIGEGLTGAALGYQRYIGQRWYAFTGAEWRRTSVVEEPFDAVDIESRLVSGQLGIGRRWLLSPEQEWRSTLGLERRQSRSFLLDEPFSFSSGPENGRSDVSLLRWRVSHARSWLNNGRRLTQLRWNVSLLAGLSALGATQHDDERPDGQYFAAQWQFLGLRWLATKNGPARWYARVDGRGQQANRRLLPLEQFGLGGYQGVRGYRENALVRDSGWATSATVGRVWQRDGAGRAKFDTAVFYDYGQARDHSGTRAASDSLASTGVAIRWQPAQAWLVEASWAHALRTRASGDTGLQDEGVHISLKFSPGRQQ